MERGGYRDLEVWRLGMDLTVEVYRITRTFPDSEKYGLVSQLQRASSSIPANLAEGYGRNSQKSLAHFLRVASGSLKEVETFLILAHHLEYIDQQTVGVLISRTDELSGKLHRFAQTAERRAQND